MADRMEELYKLAKETFAAEHQRFTRLEAKASSYLAALTFLIGFALPFGLKLFGTLIPPNTFSSWLTLNLLLLSMVGLVVAWFIAFSVIKVSKTPSLPLSDELLSFLKNNKLIDIHYALSKGYSREWKQLVEINDKKARLVTLAHKAIRANVVLILIISFVGFLRTWNSDKAVVVPPPSVHLESSGTTNLMFSTTNFQVKP